MPDYQGHEKKSILIFNLEKLENLAEFYKTAVNIVVGPKKDEDEDDESESYNDNAGRADSADSSTEETPPSDRQSSSGIDNDNHSIESSEIGPVSFQEHPALSAHPAKDKPAVGFWQVYDKLLEKEQLNPDNHMSDDKNTVGRATLIEALYDSGQFSRLQAQNLINDALRGGELKIVATDTYRKAR